MERLSHFQAHQKARIARNQREITKSNIVVNRFSGLFGRSAPAQAANRFDAQVLQAAKMTSATRTLPSASGPVQKTVEKMALGTIVINFPFHDRTVYHHKVCSKGLDAPSQSVAPGFARSLLSLRPIQRSHERKRIPDWRMSHHSQLPRRIETHPGPRLRGKREAIGLTLSAASYKARIDIGRLSKFERGVGDLTAEQDAKLQRVLAEAMAAHRKELDLVLAQDRAGRPERVSFEDGPR